jgi:predicted nucleic acid-binding protein
MIFLDANIFLRFLAGESNAQNRERVEIAGRLLQSIFQGDAQATTSEVVLHEVCFILQSKHHYGRAPAEIVEAMLKLLDMPSLVFPHGDREVYRRALNLWATRPALGFADAVIAARCERGGYELATFDGHFDCVASVRRWSSDADPQGVTLT